MEAQPSVLDRKPRNAEVRPVRRGCFAAALGFVERFRRLRAIEKIGPVVATVLVDAQRDRRLDQDEPAELEAPLQQRHQREPQPRVPRGHEISVAIAGAVADRERSGADGKSRQQPQAEIPLEFEHPASALVEGKLDLSAVIVWIEQEPQQHATDDEQREERAERNQRPSDRP